MDFNINNETFGNAYKCLVDANTLLEAGLGNFNELDNSALILINKDNIENNSKLNTMVSECQELKGKMYNTIKYLSEFDVESNFYFRDLFNSYNVDFDYFNKVDYGSDEWLAYVRKFAKREAYQNVGPSGVESWCPEPVSQLVKNMHDIYKYTNLEDSIREDGVRVLSGTDPNGNDFEDLVIVAADVYHEKENPGGTFERGQIVETSLGKGIIVDKCERAMNERIEGKSVWFDIYATWWDWDKPYASIVYGEKYKYLEDIDY